MQAESAKLERASQGYEKQVEVFCGDQASSLWEGSSSISDCLDACTAKTVCFGVGFKTPANEAKQAVWCIQYSFVEFCSYATNEDWTLYTKDVGESEPPSLQPTLHPSSHPTLTPSAPPTVQPTPTPTLEPTPNPTAAPTGSYGQRLRDGTEVLQAGIDAIESALDDDAAEEAFGMFSAERIVDATDYIDALDDDYLKAESEAAAAEELLDFFEEGGDAITEKEAMNITKKEEATAAGADLDSVVAALGHKDNPREAKMAVDSIGTFAPSFSPTHVPSVPATPAPSALPTALLHYTPNNPLDLLTEAPTAMPTKADDVVMKYGVAPNCSPQDNLCNLPEVARDTCCNPFVAQTTEMCEDCVAMCLDGGLQVQGQITALRVADVPNQIAAIKRERSRNENARALRLKLIGGSIAGTAALGVLAVAALVMRQRRTTTRWYVRNRRLSAPLGGPAAPAPSSSSPSSPSSWHGAWSFEASDIGGGGGDSGGCSRAKFPALASLA
eukprot:g98.t1